MFRIFQSHVKLTQSLRNFIIINTKNGKQCFNLRNFNTNNLPSFKPESNRFKKIKFTHVAFAITSGAIVQVSLKNNRALCEGEGPKKTRMTTYKKSEQCARFDWKKFWEYLQPHLYHFIAAIAGALAVAMLNIQIPQVMGGVINVIANYTETKNSENFINEMKLPALKLIAMYVGQSVCTFFYIYMLSNLGEKIAYEMKTDLFKSILKQDIAFYDQQRTGEIINRITTDVQEFKSCFKQTVSGGLKAAAQIIGSSVSLLMISPHMTFVTLLCIPTVIAIGTVVGALLRQLSRRAQAQIEKTTAVAEEAVSNIRTVRAFAMEDQEMELFDLEAELTMDLNDRLGFGIGWFQAGTNLFLNGTVLATLYMGGYLLSSEKLTAGQLMAYLMASQTIQRSLGQISLLFGSVIRGLASGARVFQFMNMQPTMNLHGGCKLHDSEMRGEIEFKNVTFFYPSRSQQVILNNFNLKIPAGKTVAIVGASGDGKSTIVSLIERFYDVNVGSITLDGCDIRKLDPSWMRKRVIGYISQEPILFGTSIMENIRYGRPDSTDEEVKEAAKMANAHEFICTFPDGYDTMVGERGATLSGGQKQRVAIARALLKNPKVLLLDEATSALDTESEKVVQNALDKATTGRTVVVIAHRLSTIQNADIIVVLKKGKIVEMGNHEELTKLRGYYWSMIYQEQDAPGA